MHVDGSGTGSGHFETVDVDMDHQGSVAGGASTKGGKGKKRKRQAQSGGRESRGGVTTKRSKNAVIPQPIKRTEVVQPAPDVINLFKNLLNQDTARSEPPPASAVRCNAVKECIPVHAYQPLGFVTRRAPEDVLFLIPNSEEEGNHFEGQFVHYRASFTKQRPYWTYLDTELFYKPKPKILPWFNSPFYQECGFRNEREVTSICKKMLRRCVVAPYYLRKTTLNSIITALPDNLFTKTDDSLSANRLLVYGLDTDRPLEDISHDVERLSTVFYNMTNAVLKSTHNKYATLFIYNNLQSRKIKGTKFEIASKLSQIPIMPVTSS
jgi:hypothetical protein